MDKSSWLICSQCPEISNHVCYFRTFSNESSNQPNLCSSPDDTKADAATARPTGTKNSIGASVSYMTRHMAMSGACWDAESSAAAPIRAHAVTESTGKTNSQSSPSIVPSVDPRAMPG